MAAKNKVKVRESDLIELISEADNYTLWGDKAWKARKRLLNAIESDFHWETDNGSN